MKVICNIDKNFQNKSLHDGFTTNNLILTNSVKEKYTNAELRGKLKHLHNCGVLKQKKEVRPLREYEIPENIRELIMELVVS